jgi:leader peptidase (prepilin peptidase)/N-methyltransferase
MTMIDPVELFAEFPLLSASMAAIFGAALTSFAGLAAWRLPHQWGLVEEPDPTLGLAFPPSFCDACSRPLPPLAWVPVLGWLAKRGRCPCGKVAVDPVYPLAEAAVGLVSAFLVLFIGPTPVTAAVLAILWCGVVAGWIDLTTEQIPEWVTVGLFWGGLLVSPLEPDLQMRVYGAFAAFALIGGVFALSGWVLKVDAMSGGDVALATAAAAWFGPMPALAMFILSAIVLLGYGIPMRRAGLDWTPYGPALASGAVGAAILRAVGVV